MLGILGTKGTCNYQSNLYLYKPRHSLEQLLRLLITNNRLKRPLQPILSPNLSPIPPPIHIRPLPPLPRLWRNRPRNMTLSRILTNNFDPEITQSHIPTEAGFLETLQVCGYAFEPGVGVVGWSGDGVAVVVGCEGGAVVADESCCYFFGGDVGGLG